MRSDLRCRVTSIIIVFQDDYFVSRAGLGVSSIMWEIITTNILISSVVCLILFSNLKRSALAGEISEATNKGYGLRDPQNDSLHPDGPEKSGSIQRLGYN